MRFLKQQPEEHKDKLAQAEARGCRLEDKWGQEKQEQCGRAAADIAAKLEARLSALLATASASQATPAVIEQALVLARLATSLSGPDTWLRLVLGPPGEWQTLLGTSHHQQQSSHVKAEQPSGDFTRRHSGLHRPAVRSAPAAEFQKLQSAFRDVARAAHETWAMWATHALSQQLQQHLSSDAALTADAGLRGWQETVIPQEEGAGEEVRFSLPGMPSPGVLLCLLSAVGELHRAGGPALGLPALQALAWHLSTALIATLRSLLQAGGHLDASLTERGVLQLLMDVRFLQQALAGGKPQSSAPETSGRTPASSVMQQRSRDFQQLESDLQERLDPIDWAMYEPFLWANAGALQQRLGVLFGAFLHMQGTPPEVMAKAAAGAEANILRMAPTAQRFAYLPISTPAAAAAGMRRLSGGFPASPKHAGWDQGAAQDYSFAGIITTRDDDVSEASRAADAATASAMDALQSRWNTQKLGAFGSMLGDKAAEVTAMAQQSLGDASLHSAFTSAFSHLQAGAPSAGGLLSSLRGFKQPANPPGHV